MLDRKPSRNLIQELKRDEMLINDDLEIESLGYPHSSQQTNREEPVLDKIEEKKRKPR